MSKLRINSFAISLDGYGAGANQDFNNPIGAGGIALHNWVFQTRTWQTMHGKDGGATGIDDDFLSRGLANVGAWIIGRNMFGPLRGPWPDDTWRGWWGNKPPYHCPVFVLTHHPRESIQMEGGTTFHFVTDGIQAALKQAVDSAKGKDVRLGGGVSTIRQYMQSKLIDEMHLAIVPILLGSGEHLLAGLNGPDLGYQCTEHLATEKVMHVVLTKSKHE
jgi:dihydrofolate reductase